MPFSNVSFRFWYLLPISWRRRANASSASVATPPTSLAKLPMNLPMSSAAPESTNFWQPSARLETAVARPSAISLASGELRADTTPSITPSTMLPIAAASCPTAPAKSINGCGSSSPTVFLMSSTDVFIAVRSLPTLASPRLWLSCPRNTSKASPRPARAWMKLSRSIGAFSMIALPTPAMNSGMCAATIGIACAMPWNAMPMALSRPSRMIGPFTAMVSAMVSTIPRIASPMAGLFSPSNTDANALLRSSGSL